MSLESVKKAYKDWKIFESEPTKILKDNIRHIMENPTTESDDFFKNIIEDFNQEETDGFWIRQAITYADYPREDKSIFVPYIEALISNEKKYWIIGSALSSAASVLGNIATYPNRTLAYAIETDRYDLKYESGSEGKLDKIASDSLRAAAYGGYIMTATNFQTGFDAGQVMKSSGLLPTVELAEEFIAKWRKEHGKT